MLEVAPGNSTEVNNLLELPTCTPGTGMLI